MASMTAERTSVGSEPRTARRRKAGRISFWPESASSLTTARCTSLFGCPSMARMSGCTSPAFAIRKSKEKASYVFSRLSPVRRRTKRSEEHTSELQSRRDLVCRLLLEKKKKKKKKNRKNKKKTNNI